MFQTSARERLLNFLSGQTPAAEKSRIEVLTPDASTREFFRIEWHKQPAIACIYGEAFVAAEQNYLDVTKLFLESHLPVAEIYAFDEASGIIILEDFGDKILRDVLLKAADETREAYLGEAIRLIARIQAATPKAFELASIASKLKFDREKLGWELNFFKTHYFESLRKQKLSAEDEALLSAEFTEIAGELETKASVLCHRDFHAANLMIDRQSRLRIIDHQDARLGSVTYDLVSLLLDRVSEPPARAWVREKRLFFLRERENLGLETIDPDVFAGEFHLQTIQRCLKATGTFSYQSVFREKAHFITFIKPMLQIVRQACERLERFPHLQRIIDENLKSST
ncbi:MAG TPA: phosphotransferase [Pyrinomonadaceae bacterium]|nr:phosphotransferase [Pyrinomonadaceae bacterium]